jgi:energy-coupling factor transport system ATP-binding protein
MTDLRLERVEYSYPNGAIGLAGVDLEIRSGESVALIGANGSGKTTLVRHLDGLLKPSSGRVLVDGVDTRTRRVAELATQVGLCFQHPDRQIFSTNVRDEVEFGARRLGASSEEAFARAQEALALVGMSDDLGRHPSDLGETRRKLLTIASVLAMRTAVVVLDEPTTGLGAAAIERVERIVSELREAGRTVITVSHDLRFVAESSQRVVLLQAGRIALDGTPAVLFAENAWPTLRRSGLEPPPSAVMGVELGLGATPTEASLMEAAGRSAGVAREQS